jgi:Predicted AAA-ATPase
LAITDQDNAIKEVQAVETFFKANLFAPLKRGYNDPDVGCISKYFITGVLPAFRGGLSPLTAITMLSNKRGFHGICGLDDEQVKVLTRAYLQDKLDDKLLDDLCDDLRKFYGGYCFASGGDLKRLHNPNFIYEYLFQYDPRQKERDEVGNTTSTHSAKILKLVADTGAFSVADIVELRVKGYVELKEALMSDFTFIDLLCLTGKDNHLTFSLLMYIGALSYGVQPQVLLIPNEVSKEMVCNYLFVGWFGI